MATLSLEQFYKAMIYLSDEAGVRFPHEHQPMIEPGEDEHITEAIWTSYPWDGSEHGFNAPDPNASPKPQWSDIVASVVLFDFAKARNSILSALRTYTQNAITAAYGAGFSWQKEMQIRLSNRHTSRQDNERDRLRVRYRAVKAEITAATTVEQLQAIQARIEDGTWADDPAPPS